MLIEHSKKIAIVITAAFLFGLAMNFFLIPAQVLASGFAGVSQLISALSETYFGFYISPGILIFILNIPVLILGWFKAGRSFTIYSFLSIVALTVALEIIPVHPLSNDILLNGIFGAVLAGIATGLTFKFGFSSGGLDIITQVISKATGKSVGFLFMVLNGLIVLAAGIVFDEEKALYTLISIYVTSKVIDYVHTHYEKLTLTVITEHADEMVTALYQHSGRGVTIMKGKGGYTKKEKDILMIVITRYELYDFKKIISSIDSRSFTNISETIEVQGMFYREAPVLKKLK